jgi:hypothetical protein
MGDEKATDIIFRLQGLDLDECDISRLPDPSAEEVAIGEAFRGSSRADTDAQRWERYARVACYSLSSGRLHELIVKLHRHGGKESKESEADKRDMLGLANALRRRIDSTTTAGRVH